MRHPRLILAMTTAILCIGTAAVVSAATITTPQTMVYNGHLLTSSNVPATGAFTVRFSLWKSADFVDGDTTGTGAVNTAAATYAGWKDAFTVTPDANGYFTVALGSQAPLPDFQTFSPEVLRSLFLQIEVKPDAAALTAYELLDVDSANPLIDRAPLLSVPFALNADMVDQRHVGTGSGSLPVLGSGGLLDYSAIPGGTEATTFTIDQGDRQNSGSIVLQFGQTLGKKLSYDISLGAFTFNAPVHIQGNLTVNGLINGVDLSQITASADNAHLKVASGAGLTVSIARGDYRIGGVARSFDGSGSVAVTDNATSNIYFTSTGLTVTTALMPTDRMIIPLATVLTSGGGISSITDRRIFNSNDSERVVARVFQPLYEGAAFEPDGSNNVGQLIVSHSGATQRNFYRWTTSRPTLQDYDIVLRVSLPKGFVRWSDNPVSLAYHSVSGDSADNSLSIQIADSAAQNVTLVGSPVTNLASATWANGNWTFSGNPVWTKGGEMLIRVKLSAKVGSAMELGALKLQYVEGSSN